MEVEITVHTSKKTIINVDIPYYYAHKMDNSIVYGKIMVDRCVSIHEYDEHIYDKEFEFKITEYHSIAKSGFGSYFSPVHKSNENAFLAAKERLKTCINTI